MLVTDTVGFVRKLPHELVEAFRSTLDSVRLSDLVVHVVDGSAPDPEGQIDAVRDGAGRDRRRRRCPSWWWSTRSTAPREATRLAAKLEGAVVRLGPDRRGDSTRCCGPSADRLRVADRVVELVIPWARGDVLAAVHREGEVVDQRDGDEAATLHVVLDDAGPGPVPDYVVA